MYYQYLIYCLFLVFLGCQSSGIESSELFWPAAGRVTQAFRPSTNKAHKGVDIASSLGTKIYSAHEGRVVYAGQGFSGYGKMILLENKKRQVRTLYGHLSKIHVSAGQHLAKGIVIGEMGQTGRASGVHLHYEVLVKNNLVDPLIFHKN